MQKVWILKVQKLCKILGAVKNRKVGDKNENVYV